jgi:hypothetical protein
MAKDIRRKVRGSWWYGWVRYTYYDIFTKSEREGRRSTDWDYATAALAHREAEKLAGGLAAPSPQYRWHGGKPSSPKTQKRASLFTIIEVGASRVEEA